MELLSLLTTPTATAGPLVWVFFASQVLVAAGGVYLVFVRQDTKALRKQALQRLGYAMLGLGALGIVVAGLYLSLVVPFNAPYWPVLVLIFEAALASFALYYARSIYPAQVAALVASTKGSRRVPPPSASESLPSSGKGPTSPVALPHTRSESSSRRDARRERKRKRK